MYLFMGKCITDIKEDKRTMSNIMPRYNELEKMMDFINKNKKNYILGAGENQRLFEKYLNMCDVNIQGYIVSEIYENEKSERVFGLDNIIESEDKDIGILTLLPDKYYNETVTKLISAGFSNLFFVSEFNKNAVAQKVKPYEKETFHLEISLAQHCNLNCQMCDHFSPVAKPRFYDLEAFRMDVERLGNLFEHKIGSIQLLGGEPLLNRNIIQYMKCVRKQFPDSAINVFTNGVLLMQSENWEEGNFLQACKEYNIGILMTIYPINLDFDTIDRKMEEYGIRFVKFNSVADVKDKKTKFSVFHPLDLKGEQDKFIFASCYQFNECMAMENGRIYTCPIIPNSVHFNEAFSQNLVVTENDFISIYEVDSWQEIAEFCSRRPPFCDYCDIRGRRATEWKQSDHTMYEWVKCEDEK